MSQQTIRAPVRRLSGRTALRGNRETFGIVARVFHWLTPMLLIGSFSLVWILPWLPTGSDRVQSVSWHRTIGLIVLALSVIRLIWRAFDRHPPALGPRPARWAARAVHLTLYGALLAIPLLGWTYTSARGHNLTFLGLPLPSLIFRDEYFSRVAINAHEWLAYMLIAAIAVHVLAALWHHFALHDRVLRRMWRL